MTNILKLTTIAALMLVGNISQATQLVSVQTINPIELIEMSKQHLEQSIKLNTMVISPIEKTVREHVVMNQFGPKKTTIDTESTVKMITLAE